MQYRVPQNVDIEDKVIGPMTLRQFMIILVAVCFMIPLYFIFQGALSIIFWFIAIIVVGGAATIAFAKYGDQNFETFLFSALDTFRKPRKRIWKKVSETEQKVETVQKVDEPKPTPKKDVDEVRGDLAQLASIVDSGGNIATAPKDRIISFGTHVDTNSEPGLSTRDEDQNPIIDPLIETAKENAPQREPLVSEVASVSPNQSFDYPKVEIKNSKISRF